uniref:Uncharacterized protein n=1 Tax=Romanomermis culicivorax TaxID=13658 RepID=A0A915LA39_ROMCU
MRIKTICEKIGLQKLDTWTRNQQVLNFFIMLKNKFGLDASEYVKLDTLHHLTCDGALNIIRDVGWYKEVKQILMCMNSPNCNQDMLQC